MAEVGTVHLAGPVSPACRTAALSALSAVCSHVTLGREEGDTVVLVGEADRLAGPNLPWLRLLILPKLKIPPPARAALLCRHTGLTVLCYAPAPTPQEGLQLLLDTAAKAGAGLQDGLVLVLGWSAVGRLLAKLCRERGMDVVGVRAAEEVEERKEEGSEVVPLSALDSLLPSAAALLCCLPATPSTLGLLDRKRLARLQHSAVLVNLGRAEVCDAAEVVQAVRAGRLAGAGLDCWWHPASPAPAPLPSLDRLVLAPCRTAQTSAEQETDLYSTVVEILRGVGQAGWDSLADHPALLTVHNDC